MNKKNEYNVAYGHYKNPVIVDEENILSLSKLFNSFDISFRVNDYQQQAFYPYSTVYFDPPYFNTFDKYSKNNFCYHTYIQVLTHLRHQKNIFLIHSNSIDFMKVYKTDENILQIELYDRINKKNPGKIRIELLYFS